MTIYEHEPADILIDRVASNEAGDEEWAAFERQAATQPRAWERLARTLRDDLQIRAALDEALAPGDSLEMTDDILAARRGPLGSAAHRWSGWAIAAVLALTWVGVSFFNPVKGPGNTTGLGGLTPVSTDAAYRDYVDRGRAEGRVLEELPSVMLQVRSVGESGEVEVYFVRQLLERARVDSAWRMQRSEDTGRQTLGPVNLASYERKEL